MLIIGTILLAIAALVFFIMGFVILIDSWDVFDVIISLLILALMGGSIWGVVRCINIQKTRTHNAIYHELKAEGWNISSDKIQVGYNTGHVYLDRNKCQVTLIADRFNGKFHLWVQGSGTGDVVGGKYILTPKNFESFKGICP